MKATRCEVCGKPLRLGQWVIGLDHERCIYRRWKAEEKAQRKRLRSAKTARVERIMKKRNSGR
jgi:hypothetical protein